MTITEPTTSQTSGRPPTAPATTELTLFELTMGVTLTQGIAIACRMELPDHLHAGHSSIASLADAAGANADAVERVLRLLQTVGIVEAVGDGAYRLTEFGDPLRADATPSVRAWALMSGSDWFWGPLGQLDACLRDERSGFEVEYGAEVFDFLGQVPQAQAEYDAAMGGVMSSEASEIVAAHDFSDDRRILDVGGGDGSLCRAILRAAPWLTGGVLDRPAVVEEARAQPSASERCTWHGGDFFEHVPGGADSYLLSRILHDWNDARATVILRQIGEAMRDDGTLLIVEQLLDENQRPFTPLCDLNMAALYGSRERSRSQMADLLATAGFVMNRAVPLTSGRYLIEARRDV